MKTKKAMGEKVFKPEIINSNVKNKRKNALNIINKKETKGREKIKEEKEEDEIDSDLDLDINDDIDIDEETSFRSINLYYIIYKLYNKKWHLEVELVI